LGGGKFVDEEKKRKAEGEEKEEINMIEKYKRGAEFCSSLILGTVIKGVCLSYAFVPKFQFMKHPPV
jgi:hypothetical protein